MGLADKCPGRLDIVFDRTNIGIAGIIKNLETGMLAIIVDTVGDGLAIIRAKNRFHAKDKGQVVEEAEAFPATANDYKIEIIEESSFTEWLVLVPGTDGFDLVE